MRIVKDNVVNAVDSVETSTSSSTSSSVSKRKPKSLEEVVLYAKQKGISETDATAFFDSMEAGGWTRGGKALRDWQAHLRSYKANGFLASQKNGKFSRPSTQSELDSKLERDPIWREIQEKKSKQ